MAYVSISKRWIDLYGASPDQLRDWWSRTKDSRALAGVEPGTSEYDDLVSFCAAYVARMNKGPGQ